MSVKSMHLGLPLVIAGLFASLLLTVASPVPAMAATQCKSNFFGLPAWYDGLTEGKDCNIKSPKKAGGLTTFIWRIVLNIIEAFLMVVGYASVIMLITGGYKYMVATGAPDKIKGAKDTIRHAIVGLIIAMASVAIVNIIAGAI